MALAMRRSATDKLARLPVALRRTCAILWLLLDQGAGPNGQDQLRQSALLPRWASRLA
jgi:hypothetical protein